MANILVIDDSHTVARAIAAALSNDGHTVKRLDFIVDLALTLRRSPPDLVILDLEMPGFPGLKLGQFIRTQCRSDVPVVVYSSRSESERQYAAEQIGAVAAVEKASSLDGLREVVAGVLARRKGQQP